MIFLREIVTVWKLDSDPTYIFNLITVIFRYLFNIRRQLHLLTHFHHR